MERTSSTPRAGVGVLELLGQRGQAQHGHPGQRRRPSGSTSWGSARSTMASGAEVCARAASTAPRLIRTPVAPVQEMRTSVRPSSTSRSTQRDRPGGVLGGESLGAVGRAVDHGDVAGAHPVHGRGGERRHRARTDDDDPATGHLAGDALERRGDEGRGGAVDVGLGARALADAQRLLEEHVEGGSDGAELLAHPQRVAGLAEDLALADDHRVEPGGDVEEVGDRAVVVVDVEVRAPAPRSTRRRGRRAGGRPPRCCRGSGRRRRRSRGGCTSR